MVESLVVVNSQTVNKKSEEEKGERVGNSHAPFISFCIIKLRK